MGVSPEGALYYEMRRSGVRSSPGAATDFFFSPNFFSIAAMLFLFFFCEEKSGLYFKTEPESHGAPLRLRVRSILSGFEF